MRIFFRLFLFYFLLFSFILFYSSLFSFILLYSFICRKSAEDFRIDQCFLEKSEKMCEYLFVRSYIRTFAPIKKVSI